MVRSTPRPHFTPGKDPVPILKEAGWAPGPVWTGGKSRPHRDSIPDRLARSSVAIPTELPGPRHAQVFSLRSYAQIPPFRGVFYFVGRKTMFIFIKENRRNFCLYFFENSWVLV